MRRVLKNICIIMFFIIVISCSFLATFYVFYIPNLKLNGSELITIRLNQDYIEEGAKGYIFNHEVNGIDIKGLVDTSKVGSYEIKYIFKVKYLKNIVTKSRIVKVTDEDHPIIELKGKDVSMYTGSKYEEPGYSASDAYDGDLTDKVLVTNNIDENKIGVYDVVYSVTDSSGNSSEATRKVNVKKRPTTSKDKDGDNTPTGGSKKGTGSGLPILMYHFFYDETLGEVGIDNNYMEIHAFEEQMKYLDDNDYYFPSWQEVADFVDGKITLPKKSVVVTIDDGHKTFLRLALPIIQKYDIKVTSFLVTRWFEKSTIKSLKNIVNCESHTHNMHRKGCTGGQNGIFRCINYDLGLADLKQSIDLLDSNEAIAYPFGDVTNNVIAITKAANFKVGVTTLPGKAKQGMDRYQLPRVRMSKGITLDAFIKSL